MLFQGMESFSILWLYKYGKYAINGWDISRSDTIAVKGLVVHRFIKF
jgi:hypothetical protein